MEELFPIPLPLDELDVVDEQHVDVAVAAFEGHPCVSSRSELMKSLVNSVDRHVLHAHAGEQRWA